MALPAPSRCRGPSHRLRLVQSDEILGDGALASCQLGLRRVGRALRLEPIEKIHEPAAVAIVGQRGRASLDALALAQFIKTPARLTMRDERVFDRFGPSSTVWR